MGKTSKNNNNMEKPAFCECGLQNEWVGIGFNSDGPITFWGCMACYRKKSKESVLRCMKDATIDHNGSLVIPLGNYGEV